MVSEFYPNRAAFFSMWSVHSDGWGWTQGGESQTLLPRGRVRGGKSQQQEAVTGFPLDAAALASSSRMFTARTFLTDLPHVSLFLLTGV